MRCRGVPGFLGVWNAEFVSLRIGEHNPWLLPLPHIYPSGPHPQATINFSCLVIRVKSRAGGSRRPWLRAWYERQACRPINGGPDRILVVRLPHDHPPEGVGPPTPPVRWLCGVDNVVLPVKAPSGLQTGTAREGKTPSIRDNPARAKPPENTLRSREDNHNSRIATETGREKPEN